MKIKKLQTKIRTIRKGDPLWLLNDGVVVCPRAGFEFSPGCPEHYREELILAIQYGYIKPVANVYAKEITMDSLRDDIIY